jgi:putative flippase GtrA
MHNPPVLKKMLDKLRSLLKGTTGRYIVVGVSVYIIELIAITVAQHLGASATFSVAISFWLGLLISFFLQKLITFKDNRMHRKVLLPQLIAATCLVLFNFGFTILVTRWLKNVLPVVATRTVALGMTTIWNFYLYRTRIFKSDSIQLID